MFAILREDDMLDNLEQNSDRRLAQRKDPIIKKMLIIDDESGYLNLLKRVFFNTARTIIDVNNGMNALRKVMEDGEVFECIVVDLKLPDGCGLNLIPIIRKYQPQASIIISTAYEATNRDQITQLVIEDKVDYVHEKGGSLACLKAFVNLNERSKRMANGEQRPGNQPEQT